MGSMPCHIELPGEDTGAGGSQVRRQQQDVRGQRVLGILFGFLRKVEKGEQFKIVWFWFFCLFVCLYFKFFMHCRIGTQLLILDPWLVQAEQITAAYISEPGGSGTSLY